MNHAQPKISVVIPIFNGMPYIRKALESVFAQEYPAYEIIVVDDGSTDESPAYLKSLGKGVAYHRIPQSGGPAKPKSVGASLATGDFVAFLDHDDVWFKNKLRRNAELIQQ
jgi:glycosyltransferase involved in cell wall biosynthesis